MWYSGYEGVCVDAKSIEVWWMMDMQERERGGASYRERNRHIVMRCSDAETPLLT